MKNILIALLVGIIIGAVGTWYFEQERESATAIDVETVGGRVALSGTAPSHEAVGRATLLALETQGVREVVSALRVPG